MNTSSDKNVVEGSSTEDVINFSVMPCKYWNMATKISYLQRRVIVHSIIYYKWDNNCISDGVYDRLSQQLVQLQNVANDEQFKKSKYYYAMYDFDGSTGYHLYDRLTKEDKKYLREIARNVIELYEKGKR